ncbi:MAG: SDR family NAD(P)-dependent oxidoreductase [Pseudomonadota bacterium]
MKKVIVTGATSGIGAAIVRAFGTSGQTVLAIARRAERLSALQKETGCQVCVSDVRDLSTLGPVAEAFAPDILVNNAGVGHGISGLDQITQGDIQAACDVNIVAPIQLTRLVLSGMRMRGRGHIINIGSIAGLHTMLSALYGSTKGAVHIFSQNLRQELKGTGIRVTEICPGRVSTEFYDTARGDTGTLAAMKHTGITELRPEDVAAAVAYAASAPSHVNVATIELLPTEQAVGGVAITPAEGANER